MKFAVAITGASGSIYGIRLLQNLPGETMLIVSKTAKKIIPSEAGMSIDEVYGLANEVYEDDDLFAPPSSGSYRYDCLFVAPCSESSVGKFANGIADTLISRAASVRIKENGRLVLLIRETPKSQIMLENELKLARCGAVILDANPGFYSNPKTVDEIVDFVVGKAMDSAGIDNEMFARWK
ncbi:MAG: UbiX family flavin prenyltransferase [Methanomassiliicoccaceae archaeon]|nr:UbiX family flavin prenyltransferase [Methanomassiliicoccaceae archaeon]